MNAVDASRVHSARRCFERFGFFLSDDAVSRVIATIQRGQAVALRKLSNSRTLFAVEIEHHRTILPLIYSSTRKTVVTVLPEKALDRYRDKLVAKSSTAAAKEVAKPIVAAPATDAGAVSQVVPPPPALETYVSQLGPLLIITAKTRREARIFVAYCVEAGTRRLTHVELRRSVATDWSAAAAMLKRKLARLLVDAPECSPLAKEAWLDRTVGEIQQAIEAQQVIVEKAEGGEVPNQAMRRAVNTAA
jgi:hypothetical protein